MSRPDRPARRAAQPTLTPLEGRQLLTAAAAIRTLPVHVASVTASRAPAVIVRAVTPSATPASAVAVSHAGGTGIAARVAAPTTTAAGAARGVTRAVTVHAVTPAVASAPGVPIHFGPVTPRLYTASRVVQTAG